MVYIVGDLHIRKEEPFFTAAAKTLRWLEAQVEPNDHLVFLGDLFHTSKPFPKEYEMAISSFSRLAENNVSVWLLAGNHEFHEDQKTFAIEPLNDINKYVSIITVPGIVDISGFKFLMLPWMSRTQFKSKDREAYLHGMYETDEPGSFIDSLKDSLSGVDFICYHFEDETVFMGGVNTGVDLSLLQSKCPKAIRIAGHIHLASKNYIGTPYQTRYDEKGQIGHILVLEQGYKDPEGIQVPLFIEYLDVVYGDEVPSDDGHALILSILDAPSIGAAEVKYKGPNIYIRKVEIVASENRTVDGEVSIDPSSDSLLELFQSFAVSNKVDERTSAYVQSLLI